MKRLLVLGLLLSSKIVFADPTYLVVNHIETPVVLKGENDICSTSTEIGHFNGGGAGHGFSTDDLSKLCTKNPNNCNVEVIMGLTCGGNLIGKVIFDLNSGIKQGYSIRTDFAINIKKYSGPGGWDQIDIERTQN